MSQPEAAAEARSKPLAIIQPSDPAIRARVLAAVDGGLSQADIARGAGVNKAIVTQYLNPAGNVYPGQIAGYERKMLYFIERVDLEFLAGIKTIATPITEQVDILIKSVRRQRIIGKGIGSAGIGKTRAASYHATEGRIVYFVSQETGNREAIRSSLFKSFGIHGGKKTYGSSTLAKYIELVKRVRAADIVFLFDQAHMLSVPAMHFLCELWNETKRGQLWLGTEKLLDKVERDEQIASRVEFGDALKVGPEDAHALIQHQIKSVLPELKGELARLTKLCEGLAAGGRFRRVEMRLGAMLAFSETPEGAEKSWCDLFETAEAVRSLGK